MTRRTGAVPRFTHTEMPDMVTHGVRRFCLAGIAMLVAVLAARPARAEVTFDWATVGNPGNAADTLVMNKYNGDGTSGYGSVGYTFRISKYDVTNAQYTAFLNLVDPTGSNALRLYNTKMGSTASSPSGAAYTGGIDRNLAAANGAKYSVKSGQESYPATWMTWAASARFVNWLASGQGSGGTESGVYDMSAIPFNNAYATPPPRAANATFFIPSENEYYKASYYDPTKNGGAGGYWKYGTRSDTAPSSVAPPGSGNAANIGFGNSIGVANTLAKTGAAFSADVDYLTNVGAYSTSTSYYGLYDVDGLVYNWTEATKENPNFAGQMLPVYRGGAWNYGENFAGAAYRNIYSGAGATSYAWYGLRVGTVAAVPEPGTLALAGVGAAIVGCSLVRRRRIAARIGN